MAIQTVSYGTERIRYTVVERPRRRTLGIEVYPSGSVIILRPPYCADALLEEKVKKRVKWISNQLAHFRQYRGTVPFRQYMGGESCRFLGRQYRLRVVGEQDGTTPTIRLTRNELLVSVRSRNSQNQVKRLLDKWYLRRASNYFNAVLDGRFASFEKRGHGRPGISIRQMKRRWGSLSESGRMTLNVWLIQAPKVCVEYVIVHELCHLVHHDHSSKFWQLLDRLMPDWQKRKRKLEFALLS